MNLSRRDWGLGLAAAGALLVARPARADWGLQQLMALLSQSRSARASFIEKKYIALLDKPVESSGELLYQAPDRLEKRTFVPKPEAMVLQGDTLTLERGSGRPIVLNLRQYPELAAFTESIRATLAGDEQALERVYAIALDGDAAHWTLTLRPLDERMAAAVQRIVIGGSGGEVRRVEIDQADRDRSVMTITPAAQ
ncbi:MAG: putative transmembrane protein [Burkholderiaceae bacterium]|jgi:hypothetical protein|nr:MAG: putative transmembrane protein [Burkholderiaceae bacterium]